MAVARSLAVNDDDDNNYINHIYNPIYSFQTTFTFFIPTSHAWQARYVIISSHFTDANTEARPSSERLWSLAAEV